jgi:hypothetical protein
LSKKYFQTLTHISCMQASPSCYAHKVLLKNIFYFGKVVCYWFTTLLCWFEDFRNLFGSNWNKHAKDIKEIKKIEKEMEKEIKKRKRALGDHIGPGRDGQPSPTTPRPWTGTPPLSSRRWHPGPACQISLSLRWHSDPTCQSSPTSSRRPTRTRCRAHPSDSP